MDKVERETHDFMNVESFSQLPFIRPAPLKEKGIRLFGKEFGGRGDVAGFEAAESESGDEDVGSTDTRVKESESNNNNNGDNNRRFECHYCCRNFPTSQALGGHQNAHKRERQHAKRAHLQSAMLHNTLSASPDHHFYGLVNYASTPPITSYPSWTTHHHHHAANTTASTRFYGAQQPINGSPLGLWRVPGFHGGGGFHRDRSSSSSLHPLALFAGEGGASQSQMGGSGSGSSSQGQERYNINNGYHHHHHHHESSKGSVQDHVSLDLHL